MTSIAALAVACFLLPSGCTDSLTSAGGEREGEATTLDVDPDSTSLPQDDVVEMEATPQGPQGNPVSGYTITWSSADTTVATVDADGVVAGQSLGFTTITASAENGESSSLSSQSKIAVVEENLVTDLQPAEYTTDVTAIGEEAYVDQDVLIDEVPPRFEAWTYVRTASDDKSIQDESAVTLTLTDTATVALAYDERATTLPDWLENWTDTDEVLATTDGRHNIFTRVFGPGTVALGGNQSGGANGAQRMYVLFIARSDSPPDDVGGRETGRLEANASTTGDSQDSDGYTVTVADSSRSIGPNGSVAFSGLNTGEYAVELTGVQSNCSVEGENPRTVAVEAENTASTTFNVSCTAQTGDLKAGASTSGDDQDSDGYTATVDGDISKDLDPNGSVTFSDLSEGEHTVELTGIQSNCSVDGENPRTVSVEAETTTSTAFDISCSKTAGALEVSASTTGDDQDSDGYTATVDGSSSKDIDPNGTVTFSGLSEGDHTLELSDVASNCAVDGENPRTVSVTADNTVSTSFSVSCTATTGSLEANASTSGEDQDTDGYTVTVDGDASKELDANGTVTFSGLSEGEHQVELTDVQSNCSVDGENPRTVTVEAGGTAETTFNVSCTALTGDLDVSASTSGDDQDSDDYTATVDGDASKELDPNGSVTFSGLSEGDHSVELSGIASNCSVDGENPRTVTVEGDSTVSTTFNVSCSALTGDMEVSASTTGDDQDSDGYTATVDGDASKDIGPNGSVTFSGLSEGDHQVELSGIQSNCTVDGENPKTVTVEGGGTASTSFNVSCSAQTGDLDVSASTSGDDQDSDGYTTTVDDSTSKDLDPNGSITFSGLEEGEHSIALSGVASNCSVDGSNPKTVTVETGNTASTTFNVSCTATTGSLEASASTTGEDQDSDGYTATVDGDTSKDLNPNGTVTFSGLSEGDHSVELTGIQSNCSIDGENPRTVTVEAGNTASTTFNVSCTAQTGDLEVSASTFGEDPDTDGYTATVDGDASKELGPNGSATFSDLAEGDHSVELSDIKSNCSVDGQNPRTVSVTAGNNATTGFSVNCEGSFGERNAVLWEYEEWSLQNASYSGNPFDVIATVTFEHQGSSKSHTTEMFYDGDDTWKFRFTGTRTGTWTFTTSSDDPELDGHSGTVDVADNTSSQTGGFLKTQGNKFGRQVDGVGTLDPVVWTVYNDAGNTTFTGGADYRKMSNWTESNIRSFASRAKTLGMNHIFLTLYNQVFVEDAFSYNDHNKSNPGLSEFQTIENVIGWARDEGVNVHFWMWGDESTRGWTPVGLEGGINGTVDQRLQRYIAARLGPIPGWTMGYGFDLYEWVSNSELEVWASNMHDHAGWPHMLMARKKDVNLTNTDVKSEGKLGPDTFSEAISKLEPDKPYVEEERFYYNRTFGFGGESQTYDMDFTMELIWRLGMAEGSGAIWGSSKAGNQYPNPEWLKTFGTFFENYLRFDMSANEALSDGIGMNSASNEHYVFFKQETSSIQVDLSGMNGSQPVVAIDTRAPYQEVDLGTLDPTNQTIDLPHSSDWAIAVGNF